ncbi:MAG: TRAP transporter small permease [Alphaproteobacteria bacterium]
MTVTRGGWRRLTAACHSLLSFVLAVSVGILVLPVALQIFSRFTSLIPHYIWTEEMARFLFVWLVMIGAMVGVRESAHFDVDIFPRMGRRGTAVVNLVTRVATLVLAATFIEAGWEFTAFAWNRISELAELPLWMIHIAWPLTGVVWAVFLGEQVFDDLRALFGRVVA